MSTRPANENPYWSAYYKSHVFDAVDVSNLCREGAHIILATRSLSSLWSSDLKDMGEEPDWSFPLLVGEHQQYSETGLFAILLKLAASYRSLDDQLSEVDEFQSFANKLLKDTGGFLTSYGEIDVKDSLRECCNKIIHADDIRPVYGNDGDDRETGVWYMTSDIELTGKLRKKEWVVALNGLQFFEAMLETVQFLNVTDDEDATEQM